MDDAQIRTLTEQDADQALVLYNQLTVGPPARETGPFSTVLQHPGTQVFGAFDHGTLAAMVTLHLLPNVLWNARPYGLIENVITHQDHRKRGHGKRVLQAACDAAWGADAYKIMLMTGKGRGATGFYEAVGFSGQDKYAMVMRRN